MSLTDVIEGTRSAVTENASNAEVSFSVSHALVPGIATIVFFLIYQQFENYVLQPRVMRRTASPNVWSMTSRRRR